MSDTSSRSGAPGAAGARVVLRPVAPPDADAMAPWLAEAVAAIPGRGAVAEHGLTLADLEGRWDFIHTGGITLAGALKDGTVVGIMRVRVQAPSRLVIDALAVRAGSRNLGYGQELVIALEESRGQPGGEVYAGVPRGNGLAIYFWLRAGYRPLYPLPPGLPPDMDPRLFWMVRRQ